MSKSGPLTLKHRHISDKTKKNEFHKQQPAHVTAHCYQTADALFSVRINGFGLHFLCLSLSSLIPPFYESFFLFLTDSLKWVSFSMKLVRAGKCDHTCIGVWCFVCFQTLPQTVDTQLSMGMWVEKCRQHSRSAV